MGLCLAQQSVIDFTTVPLHITSLLLRVMGLYSTLAYTFTAFKILWHRVSENLNLCT